MGNNEATKFPEDAATPKISSESDESPADYRVDFTNKWVYGPEWKGVPELPETSKDQERKDNIAKIQESDIYLLGRKVPRPFLKFRHCALSRSFPKTIQKIPTRIQKFIIPIVSAKRDLVCCVHSGYGKTIAYLIPVMHDLNVGIRPALDKDNKDIAPRAIIITPNRTTSFSVYEKTELLITDSNIRLIIKYDVRILWNPKKDKREECDILIVTVKKLQNLIKRGAMNFSFVKYVIIEEANRLIQMNSWSDIISILSHQTMPAAGKKSVLLFCTTFVEEIQKFALRFLRHKILMSVVHFNGIGITAKQTILPSSKVEKHDKLHEVLKNHPDKRTVVFVKTKAFANLLAITLSIDKVEATSLHSKPFEKLYNEPMRKFEEGSCKILIASGDACTDFDMEGVGLVVNFDLPKTVDEYILRIGRIGDNEAISFFDASEDLFFGRAFIKMLANCNEVAPSWLRAWY